MPINNDYTAAEVTAYMKVHQVSAPHSRCIVCVLWEEHKTLRAHLGETVRQLLVEKERRA